MAKTELITTLHKGANTDIDVFPNIKKQNIPEQAIDESKLDPALLQKITPVVANPTIVGTEADLTSIKIGNTKYKVTGGGGGGSVMVKDCSPNEWITKTWVNLPADVQGFNMWTDGDNIYISLKNSGGSYLNYVLDKSTSTWSPKTWNGHADIQGGNVWTDGENIYYSEGSKQYVLDKATSTWLDKTWTGFTNLYSTGIWTDGENIYYSHNFYQYVLDKETSTWTVKTWNGLDNFIGSFVWTDGENIYYSLNFMHYVLDKTTSTWSAKTWSGTDDFLGSLIWTDGENIYYSNGPEKQYVLDVANSAWNIKSWKGLDEVPGSGALYAQGLWTDGDNYYYSNGDTELVLSPLSAHHLATILEKVAETGDYNDLKNTPQEMNITSQEIDEYFEVCDVDASVTIEDEDAVLNLTNADIVEENGEPVLTTEVPNVSVQNNILEIE